LTRLATAGFRNQGVSQLDY